MGLLGLNLMLQTFVSGLREGFKPCLNNYLNTTHLIYPGHPGETICLGQRSRGEVGQGLSAQAAAPAIRRQISDRRWMSFSSTALRTVPCKDIKLNGAFINHRCQPLVFYFSASGKHMATKTSLQLF